MKPSPSCSHTSIHRREASMRVEAFDQQVLSRLLNLRFEVI